MHLHSLVKFQSQNLKRNWILSHVNLVAYILSFSQNLHLYFVFDTAVHYTPEEDSCMSGYRLHLGFFICNRCGTSDGEKQSHAVSDRTHGTKSLLSTMECNVWYPQVLHHKTDSISPKYEELNKSGRWNRCQHKIMACTHKTPKKSLLWEIHSEKLLWVRYTTLVASINQTIELWN